MAVRDLGRQARRRAAGPAADDWLSAVLDRKVRLVPPRRPDPAAVDPAYARPATG
jgi:uncharacterized protein YcbX